CAYQAGSVRLGTWEKGLDRIKDGVVTTFALHGTDQSATALCEDREGRLWLGRFGGVGIFQNGAITTAGVPSGLSNHIVSAIYQDRAGALWFGAERGLF